MAELTVEQRDALLQQNASSLARQADAAESLVAAFVASDVPVAKKHFHDLVALCMTATTRTLTTSSTDATRAEASVNAVEMAIAAWPLYKQGIDSA